MKQNLLLLKILLLFCLVPFVSSAQVNVTGTVTDASRNYPLPGVSVKIKGSNTGTVTSAEGKFTLSNVPNGSTIVFSYLGYINLEAAAAPTLNVQLKEDFARLEEVVVTGLATSVKRSNLANAVSTVSARELVGTTNPQTVDAALSGKIPGANITSNSGAPGGGFSVRLRGVTSVNGNTQPLYVIDGVFIDNSDISPGLNAVTAAAAGGNPSNQDNATNRIADINPDDIENIEILKGASAAAIYGALASSGVVIITTKKGSAGKTKVSFRQDFGQASLSKKLGIRNFTEQRVIDTYGASALSLFNQAGGKVYNYEDEMYGNKGFLSTSNLSLSGGDEKTRFFVSGLYSDEEGIIKTTGYEKSSVRANIDHRISDRFNFSITTNYINSSTDRGLTNNDNSGVTYGVALSSTPSFINLYPNESGLYPNNPFAASNPLQTRDLSTNNEKVNRFIGGLTFNSFLQQNSTSVTKLVFRGGADYYNLKSTALFPRLLQFQSGGNGTDGASIQGNTNNLNLNFSAFVVNTLNAFNNKATFNTTLGTTLENFKQETILNIATVLTGSQTNVSQAAALKAVQTQIPRKNRGLFFQEEVNFDDKLILTGGLRLDKSSDNADVSEYQLFPKASAAFNVSNFDFWNISSINQFKIRAAYGESGNFPPFGSKFTDLVQSNIGGSGGVLITTQQGNDDIRQERQKEFETGMDLSFLQGKVSFEGSYYQKSASNLIFANNVPTSSGFSTQIINGGTLRNRGVELSLNVRGVDTENFKWVSHTTFWKNKSVVTKLDVPAFNLGGFGNTLGTFRIEEGKVATQILGIDDGSVKVLGNAEPKFQMNFNNDFTLFKNLSLAFQLHWKYKYDNINLTELLTDLGGTSPDYDDDDDGDGIINAIERTSLLGSSARPFVQDASYLRIREVGLYYNLPNTVLRSAFNNVVSAVKVGFSGNNLYTFTKYKSYDPEVSNFGGTGFSTGVEVTPFPQSKRLFFHLTVEL
ncbi:SusC/RagA family TonB-linked outer membrane protein [Daejeonella oryzae]|uniref:SusC/RagA family TonB-linked outer membrane protein n=1 Tax=Daejeonella oryzae TaxID=1122943 RepID=UPI00047B1BF1|nr:SusC/RagA family TonB-linked outer membrane protein [Daejeonella oryzae]